jgi:uncharacterized protein
MDNSVLRTLSLALVALMAASIQSGAAMPSFDCGKVSSEAETMVCADAQLAALDRETARLFRLAPDGSYTTDEMRKYLIAVQRGFIKGRDDCWKAEDKRACIASNYVIRIAELRQSYADARSDDGRGISAGPMEVQCEGINVGMAATFVNTDPPMAYLAWLDNNLVMTLTPSASGARYAVKIDGGERVFWTRGDGALFSAPDQPDRRCKLTTPASENKMR